MRALAGLGLTVTLTATSLLSCSDDRTVTTTDTTCAGVDPATATASCTPLYEPSYDNVFAKTLKPSCAKSGVSCHASTGRQGGIAFDDADDAYRAMLESTKSVRPGDPRCSSLVRRITATDGLVRMPPGRSLDAAEQCAIVQWIAGGAKR
jgi:hypothetical protein